MHFAVAKPMQLTFIDKGGFYNVVATDGNIFSLFATIRTTYTDYTPHRWCCAPAGNFAAYAEFESMDEAKAYLSAIWALEN